MNRLMNLLKPLAAASLMVLGVISGPACAGIVGIHGPAFSLTAKQDYISTADGNSHLAWGYADTSVGGRGTMQYPGPTLIVNQGEAVTIELRNELPTNVTDLPPNVSLVFPGQSGVTATGGMAGLLTNEAPPDGITTVTYSFVASQPGTYLYYSGTQPDLQTEMGLVGAIIVLPSGVDSTRFAYGHPGSAFDHEYLLLLTEMDPSIHALIEQGLRAQVDTTVNNPVLWFINGRTAPDTMLENDVPWMPTQPYNAMPRMHPGEKLLMRVANAGRDLHPFHHHGNNTWTIARNGRLLESAPGAGPDLATSDYTIKAIPGETYDAIYEWTGKNLGWDIYGTDNAHTCTADPSTGFDAVTHEWCGDHGKVFPVTLPNQLDLTNGEFWSGSPFLGAFGVLPPGTGGVNLNAGYFHMWHSHTEREMTNDDIFPGGMMTMVIIEPPGVPIQ